MQIYHWIILIFKYVIRGIFRLSFLEYVIGNIIFETNSNRYLYIT